MQSGRIALFLFVLLLAVPGISYAKDMQADQQCPPGGQVGQKCQDTTNGYVTQGTCTHINVCKATSWNTNPPKGCGSSGNIYAPTGDCPKGPKISGGIPRATTSTQPIAVDSNSPFRSDIFEDAFSDIAEGGTIEETVSTTSVNGIEYVVFGGETLQAGTPLTEEPPAIVPPQRTMLALGSVYDLKPIRAEGVDASGAEVGQSYTPSIGTFTSRGTVQYSPPVDFIGQVVRLSGSMAGAFSQSVGHLFEESGIVRRNEPAPPAAPPLSLYDQVSYRLNTFPDAREAPEHPNAFFAFVSAILEFISARVFPSFPR